MDQESKHKLLSSSSHDDFPIDDHGILEHVMSELHPKKRRFYFLWIFGAIGGLILLLLLLWNNPKNSAIENLAHTPSSESDAFRDLEKSTDHKNHDNSPMVSAHTIPNQQTPSKVHFSRNVIENNKNAPLNSNNQLSTNYNINAYNNGFPLNTNHDNQASQSIPMELKKNPLTRDSEGLNAKKSESTRAKEIVKTLPRLNSIVEAHHTRALTIAYAKPFKETSASQVSTNWSFGLGTTYGMMDFYENSDISDKYQLQSDFSTEIVVLFGVELTPSWRIATGFQWSQYRSQFEATIIKERLVYLPDCSQNSLVDCLDHTEISTSEHLYTNRFTTISLPLEIEYQFGRLKKYSLRPALEIPIAHVQKNKLFAPDFSDLYKSEDVDIDSKSATMYSIAFGRQFKVASSSLSTEIYYKNSLNSFEIGELSSKYGGWGVRLRFIPNKL